jgi:hypothetical protein
MAEVITSEPESATVAAAPAWTAEMIRGQCDLMQEAACVQKKTKSHPERKRLTPPGPWPGTGAGRERALSCLRREA